MPNRSVTVVLLVIFMLVNFWDRAAFGFAGAPIMHDLGLSHAEFGLLGGAFFWLFSPSAITVGWLADRWSSKWLMGAMGLAWAAAQALMYGARSLPSVLVSRLVLGAGEGPAFPTALYVAFGLFPEAGRAMLTAIVSVGVPLGIASGALVVTSCINAFGWRTAFGVLSLLSIVWSVLWLVTQRAAFAPSQRTPAEKDGTRIVRFNSTTAGVIVAAFCVYWVLALAVNWFPAVLQIADGLPVVSVGRFLGVAWALQAVAFLLAARWTGSLRSRGKPSEIAFARPAALAIALSGLCMVAAAAGAGKAIELILVALCLSGVAVATTSLPPIVAEITPLQSRGAALGIFAGLSSTAGMIAPPVFGRIVDLAGGGAHAYRVALVASGALLLVAAPIAAAMMKPTLHRAVRAGFTSVRSAS